MRTALLVAALALTGCAHPPPTDWIGDASFGPVGFADRVEAAVLDGPLDEANLYTIRVTIAEGGTMPPHTHPDERMMTVLSGEVWYGFGEAVDLETAPLYRAGDYFVVPANQPHYARAKTDVIYQESGMAPTATTPLP